MGPLVGATEAKSGGGPKSSSKSVSKAKASYGSPVEGAGVLTGCYAGASPSVGCDVGATPGVGSSVGSSSNAKSLKSPG